MSFKTRLSIAMLILGFTSVSAHAAFFDVTDSLVIKKDEGKLILAKANFDQFVVKFSNAHAVETILYSDDDNKDIGSQNANNVGNVLKSQFGLASFSQVDKGGKGNIESGNGPFQYLALHIGNDRELFIKFLFGIEKFDISISKKGSISDWRAYNGEPLAPVNPVPVPAAVWLFASALAGLMGTTRKTKLVKA